MKLLKVHRFCLPITLWFTLWLLMSAVDVYAQKHDEQRVKQGMDLLNKAMYDEAIEEFDRAIEINPENAVAYYQRAIAYQKKGKRTQAISDYSKAIEINPNDAEFYYNRGILYYSQDFPDHAIADWNKAIEISPDSSAIYQKRAFLYFLREEYDKSWRDVHKVEELGYQVDSNFLEELKKFSQRDK